MTLSSNKRDPSIVMLLPIMVMVFIAYFILGIVLPVLPLYVHHGLGLDAFVVGLVVGGQFAAAVFTRLWAGRHVDRWGSKHAVVAGMLIAVVSGLCYLVSIHYVSQPKLAVKILILGRLVLGCAESFLMTGALTWGIALMGPQNTGKVMSWVGTALYAALAVSAPIGTALYANHGFTLVAWVVTLIPLVTLLIIAFMPSLPPPSHHVDVAFNTVARIVWMPGLGVALSGVGFGSIMTFIVLLFAQHGWGSAWVALTALSISFIIGRSVFGHLPDKFGGAKVALVCIAIEAVGQLLIWLAHSPVLALIGVALSGLGFSLLYPSFGVEVIRRASEKSRGLAMGAYTAFLDLSIGLGSPALGLVANVAGFSTLFLVSTLVVSSSIIVALRLLPSDNL